MKDLEAGLSCIHHNEHVMLNHVEHSSWDPNPGFLGFFHWDLMTIEGKFGAKQTKLTKL